jgi:hypothetical protein
MTGPCCSPSSKAKAGAACILPFHVFAICLACLNHAYRAQATPKPYLCTYALVQKVKSSQHIQIYCWAVWTWIWTLTVFEFIMTELQHEKRSRLPCHCLRSHFWLWHCVKALKMGQCVSPMAAWHCRSRPCSNPPTALPGQCVGKSTGRAVQPPETCLSNFEDEWGAA